jgi:hypothetical protein
MALPLELIAGHIKREAVRDEKRGHDFKRGPCLRNVLDGAIDPAAAELDGPGFQDTTTGRDPMLIHEPSRHQVGDCERTETTPDLLCAEQFVTE